jgi:hypothetical protein
MLIFLLFTGCAVKDVEVIKDFQCFAESKKSNLGIEIDFNIITDEILIIDGQKEEFKRVNPDIDILIKDCLKALTGGCLYPWDCEKRPKRVAKISINALYFDKKSKKYISYFLVDKRSFLFERKEDKLKDFLKELTIYISKIL